jgi:glycosyltransferase involved in cell wall biosynthesis
MNGEGTKHSAIPSLHVIGSREMGGAERWFVRFLDALAAAGNPVEALVRRDSELARRRASGIPYAELPMRTVWDPLSHWQVTRYAMRSRAPIVQTYMGRATRLTHLTGSRGKVHVARLGGYYKLAPFAHAHAWVGNTRGVCDWMIRNGLPADRVFHITNFAEPARDIAEDHIATLRRAIDARDDDWLILHPARFVRVKGHDVLLEAFARLPAIVEGRRTRLILLGDGGLSQSLHAQASSLGIDQRIVWAGWQHDPAPWFRLCDMVVFPSRDEETLGNVILEAWAYGKPLVTSAFRGAREIVRPDDDASMVPCEDPAALAEGMGALLQSPAQRAALVMRGTDRLAREFSPSVIVKQYQELYAWLVT